MSVRATTSKNNDRNFADNETLILIGYEEKNKRERARKREIALKICRSTIEIEWETTWEAQELALHSYEHSFCINF